MTIIFAHFCNVALKGHPRVPLCRPRDTKRRATQCHVEVERFRNETNETWRMCARVRVTLRRCR